VQIVSDAAEAKANAEYQKKIEAAEKAAAAKEAAKNH
jgi:hypothetical protein